jgi:hypothetical protein
MIKNIKSIKDFKNQVKIVSLKEKVPTSSKGMKDLEDSLRRALSDIASPKPYKEKVKGPIVKESIKKAPVKKIKPVVQNYIVNIEGKSGHLLGLSEIFNTDMDDTMGSAIEFTDNFKALVRSFGLVICEDTERDLQEVHNFMRSLPVAKHFSMCCDQTSGPMTGLTLMLAIHADPGEVFSWVSYSKRGGRDYDESLYMADVYIDSMRKLHEILKYYKDAKPSILKNLILNLQDFVQHYTYSPSEEHQATRKGEYFVCLSMFNRIIKNTLDKLYAKS